jgi:hypothetical protein
MILRILLAVIVGILATALLDYFGVLNHALNVLIGIVVGLLVYFNGFPG